MEDLVKRLFKKARKDLLYPPILKVELADIELSDIDFSGRLKILIGKKVLEKLSHDALIGIFHHELNHWVRHPFDAKTIILENHYLGDIQNRTIIRNLYDDVVVTLDLLINKELREIVNFYRETPPLSKSDKVLRAFYNKITGLDFGDFYLEPYLIDKITTLLDIDFLNTTPTFLKSNIRKFASIMKDIVEKEMSLPFSAISLNALNPHDIRKSLINLAKELTLEEFRLIVDDLTKENACGVSPGNKYIINEFKMPDIKWYETRAMDYMIYIKSIFRDDSLYPHEIKDFEIEESFDLYNPIESYGMLIPGVAKKFTLEGFEGNGNAIPSESLIIIDSSGSMTNPNINFSYAVLSAFCIARNYLENGSKVGVINFSDRNINLLPTKEKHEIYETLKIYQGGGTTLHIEDFLKYLEAGDLKEKKEMDYIFITDSGIHNIEELLDKLKKIKGRITFLWIKSGKPFNERFQIIKKTLPHSVTFVEVKDEKDLPKIAVGEAFKEYAESN